MTLFAFYIYICVSSWAVANFLSRKKFYFTIHNGFGCIQRGGSVIMQEKSFSRFTCSLTELARCVTQLCRAVAPASAKQPFGCAAFSDSQTSLLHQISENSVFFNLYILSLRLYLPRFDWMNGNFIEICVKCIYVDIHGDGDWWCGLAYCYPRNRNRNCSYSIGRSDMRNFKCNAFRLYRSAYTRRREQTIVIAIRFACLLASVSSRLSCDDCRGGVGARMKWVTSSVQGHLADMCMVSPTSECRHQKHTDTTPPPLNQTVLIDFHF